MSKILTKTLVILLLAIIFISQISTIVKAVYEITEANIVQIGDAEYHLKYYKENLGMYTYCTCSIVGHYEKGKFYPAYCLDRDLHGVGAVDSYTVDVNSLINNDKVWRAVKNGYPYKTAKEMGLSSDFNAFAVTKFAIYCLIGQADVNLYMAEDDDSEAQAMLKALHNLVDIGQNGKDKYSEELKISKTGDFTEDGDYYSITYKVNAGTTISQYEIKSITGLQEGDIITDEKGNVKNSFKSGENFKIKIAKSNLNSDKNINIEIKASLKNYPMFYGKTRVSGTQNYLLTASSYQDITSSINTKLQLNNAKLVINKIDDETKKGIEGVEFELYNSKNELIETKTTNSKGQIEFSNLYQGNYILKETKANKNYVLNKDAEYKVDLKYNKTTSIDVENEYKKGTLTIYKVDKDNKDIPIENVEFELYNKDSGKLIGNYFTNKEGKIEVKNLKIGNYTLKEKSANKWYNLAEDKDIEIKWNEDTKTTVEDEIKKGQVKVIKVDKDDNKIKIPNVEFEVLDTKGNVLETIKTNENGIAYTKEYAIRDFEKLQLREIKTDEIYELNNETKEITLEEGQIKTITFENEKKKGQVKVIKTDLDNKEIKLQGVNFNVIDNLGNIVDTITTNENGEAVSKLLPINQEYTIQETSTLKNYVLSEKTEKIQLSENEIKNVTFENEKKKGQIRVIKVDSENNEVKLENVEFNVLDEKGNIVEKLVTNKQGEAITKDLPIDKTYTIQETKTNENYILTEETQTVQLEENKITDIIFENEKIKGKLKILKTTSEKSEISGKEKGEPLEGAKFEIYNSEGKVIDTISTDANGIAESKPLEKGKYKVKEIATNKWYLLDEKTYEIEITTNKQIINLDVENKPVKPNIEIDKKGEDSAYVGDEIEYQIDVKNTGNVKLENFIWEDEIPTDYIKVTKLNLGTYNQENKYSLYYKTNFTDDYVLLLEDISTLKEEKIDFSKELANNEYVTNIKLDFGTVDVGFKTENKTSIFARINSNVKSESSFENKATLTGAYKGHKISKGSKWKTIVYKILPLTGC